MGSNILQFAICDLQFAIEVATLPARAAGRGRSADRDYPA
jgi:hypothetical protein